MNACSKPQAESRGTHCPAEPLSVFIFFKPNWLLTSTSTVNVELARSATGLRSHGDLQTGADRVWSCLAVGATTAWRHETSTLLPC